MTASLQDRYFEAHPAQDRPHEVTGCGRKTVCMALYYKMLSTIIKQRAIIENEVNMAYHYLESLQCLKACMKCRLSS